MPEGDVEKSSRADRPSHGGRGIARLALIAVVLAGLTVAWALLPVDEWLRSALEWVAGLGVWGPALVVVFYIVGAVFMLPGSVLTIGAGVLFGVVWGTVTVSIASTLGAGAAFLVGRTLARDWVARKVSANPKFAAIDDAVGREGFKIVLLTRLSPVFPFNLLNYAYGLTKVPFWKYILASWIGMLPGTLMYVYVGAAVGSLATATAERRARGPLETVAFYAGLAVAVAVAVVVTRIARKALTQAVPDAKSPQPRGGDAE